MAKECRVEWVMDFEADNAEHAARRALAVQRDPNSTATFFSVLDMEKGESEDVDLEEIGQSS